jgi:lipopolysaccharide heptosyltransferase II
LLKNNIHKILIIKPRGIGDVVLSTIVINNLHKHFDNLQLDYLVEKPSASFLNSLPQINKVLVLERKSLKKKAILLLEIIRNKYDLILDFYSNPTTALLTFLSFVKYRAGFPYRGRKYAYNIYGPIERGKYHAAELHLKFLEMLNIETEFKELLFGIDDDSRKYAADYFGKYFKANDFVIGICPTGGWESKKCDPDIFAEIAKIVSNKLNAKIFIVWGKGDEKDTKAIKEYFDDCIIAPETSLQQMAALIEKCDVIIANDSGPMHIAVAVKTPVLALHGPTSPFMQGPYGEMHEWIRNEKLDCIECNLLVCPKKHECFRELSMEMVYDKLTLLIAKNNLARKIEKY